jgi:Trypsin
MDNARTTFIKYGASFSGKADGGNATIRDIYIHPEYIKTNPYWKEFDVCLVNMTEPFPFQPGFVMPKKMFRTNEVLKPGTVCLVAGYGSTATDADRVLQRRLYFLPVSILEDKVCENTFEEFFEYHVCAGLPRSDSGLCAGDSGVGVETVWTVLSITY